jgi:recombinational DNA repair protein (RecF pathway)
MKVLKCDVCHKEITTEVNQRGYFHVADRDLCEACYEQMNLSIVRPVIRTRQPFNYEWFDRLVRDSMEKAIAKGKWEARQ